MTKEARLNSIERGSNYFKDGGKALDVEVMSRFCNACISNEKLKESDSPSTNNASCYMVVVSTISCYMRLVSTISCYMLVVSTISCYMLVVSTISCYMLVVSTISCYMLVVYIYPL